MNVEAIYMDGLHIDDEIIYTEEELEGIFKEYEEKIWERSNRKEMIRKMVWLQ